VELLNIKLRLLVASVDKAMQMGINWWESDPYLSSQPHKWRRRTACSTSDSIAWRRDWGWQRDESKAREDDRRGGRDLRLLWR